jgi:hypothetical protein
MAKARPVLSAFGLPRHFPTITESTALFVGAQIFLAILLVPSLRGEHTVFCCDISGSPIVHHRARGLACGTQARRFANLLVRKSFGLPVFVWKIVREFYTSQVLTQNTVQFFAIFKIIFTYFLKKIILFCKMCKN